MAKTFNELARRTMTPIMRVRARRRTLKLLSEIRLARGKNLSDLTDKRTQVADIEQAKIYCEHYREKAKIL